MSPDEIEVARVRNAASMSSTRKHYRVVDLIDEYPCRHVSTLRREYVSG